jgi:hypothetical protein
LIARLGVPIFPVAQFSRRSKVSQQRANCSFLSISAGIRSLPPMSQVTACSLRANAPQTTPEQLITGLIVAPLNVSCPIAIFRRPGIFRGSELAE